MKGVKRLGGDPDKPLPDGWDAIDPKTGAPVGIDKGWDYAPGASTSDTVRSMAQKTVQWPYTLAKAYMQNMPDSVRDALAMSYRSLPSVADDARRYAAAALAGRKVDEYRTLGLLTSQEIGVISATIGATVTGFDFALDVSAVKHVFDKHGNESTEALRGQKAVTVADFSLLNEVINTPDEIIDGGKTEQGRRTLQYVKNINGSTYHAVFEVRTGRKMLVLLTFWIRS